ncbi:MAG: carboxypeptidase-like regulatory domain-containing protein, partial [Bacteroidales bacterium]|nr:carboxypeptidase-like regulatory domain-containing protein [Bacteroidales bacterium]
AEALKSQLWTLHATFGFKNILGSDFNFQKFSLNVMHKWRTGYLGQLDYSLTGEIVLGKVPYPEAIIPQGNEPVFAAERAFNMMNFFEFVADKSVSGIFLHHFDGLFFNRVPLLRKLKWREVAGFNFVFSTYSKDNYIRTADNPNGLLPQHDKNGYELTPFRIMDFGKPYMEVSYGIENILKVIRIQAFHRLSYLDPGPDGRVPPKFMIKGSFFIRL